MGYVEVPRQYEFILYDGTNTNIEDVVDFLNLHGGGGDVEAFMNLAEDAYLLYHVGELGSSAIRIILTSRGWISVNLSATNSEDYFMVRIPGLDGPLGFAPYEDVYVTP